MIHIGEAAVRIIGKGLSTGLVRDSVFTREQLGQLNVRPERPAFDGDASLFRLGIEAQRLGLAYEYPLRESIPFRISLRPFMTIS